MKVIPKTTYGSLLVGWDYSHGKDEMVLIVGQKRMNESVEIINAFHGKDAEELYEKLTTRKQEETNDQT
jgi:hypothetical protein